MWLERLCTSWLDLAREIGLAMRTGHWLKLTWKWGFPVAHLGTTSVLDESGGAPRRLMWRALIRKCKTTLVRVFALESKSKWWCYWQLANQKTSARFPMELLWNEIGSFLSHHSPLFNSWSVIIGHSSNYDGPATTPSNGTTRRPPTFLSVCRRHVVL